MKKIAVLVLLALLSASPVIALQLNDSAPTFSLRDSSGKDFYLSDALNKHKNRKQKGIILSFFASWCEPCKKELPLLNGITEELKSKGVEVVLIGYREDFEKFESMLTRLNVTKPLILSDPYGKVGAKYGVRSLPVTFFIDMSGRVRHIIFGEANGLDDLRKSARVLAQ